MSLWLLGPQNINEFMTINDWVGFKQTKTDITLFRLSCLTTLTIQEFEDGTVS